MTISTTTAVLVLAALVVGGVLGWVVAALRERARTAAAESRAETALERRSELETEVTELAEARSVLERKVAATDVEVRTAREQLEAQKAFVEGSRKQLEDAFKALASDALEGSSQQFLKLAEQRWQTTREEAAGELEKRKAAIETLLEPLKLTLKNLDEKTGVMEKERRGAYDALKEHLTQLQGATSSLQDKTTTLASALRGTQVRGRWGEIALQKHRRTGRDERALRLHRAGHGGRRQAPGHGGQAARGPSHRHRLQGPVGRVSQGGGGRRRHRPRGRSA